MKAAEVSKVECTRQQTRSTGTARRSPRYIEQQLTGCTLPELMQRSETVKEVMKHLLEFSVPLKKNMR
ncbi:MAG: hypothetical protein ACXWDN_20460 [Limisphaerales bacterium]